VTNDAVLSFTDGTRDPSTWRLFVQPDAKDALSTEAYIDRLFNPSGRTAFFPYQAIKRMRYPPLNKVSSSRPTSLKGERQVLEAGLEGEESFRQLLDTISSLPFLRVVPFTDYMKDDLARALTTSL